MFLFISILIVYLVLQSVQLFAIKQKTDDIKQKLKMMNMKFKPIQIPLFIRIVPMIGISFIISHVIMSITLLYTFIFKHNLYVEQKAMKKAMLAMAKYEGEKPKERIRIPKGYNPQYNPNADFLIKNGYNLQAPPPIKTLNNDH